MNRYMQKKQISPVFGVVHANRESDPGRNKIGSNIILRDAALMTCASFGLLRV